MPENVTHKDQKTSLIVRNISVDQARDTGMAMVLICLLVAIVGKVPAMTVAAAILLVINMTAPAFFKPAGVVWLSLSHLLGSVVSRILLTIVYFLIVTPVGALRRFMGKDTLKLKAFRKDSASVFTERNHTYTGDDIDKPY